MKRQFLNILCYAMIITAISCDDFLEVDAPNSQLNSGNVFEDKATATAAMTDIYAKMRDAGLLTGNSSGLSHLLGVYADEMDYYGAPEASAYVFYHNSLVPSNGTIKSLWNNTYNQIYSANAVISGIDASQNLPASYRDRLKGEALLVRAMLHFYLTNVFGAVPYITSTNYEQNSHSSKLDTQTVYARCIDDLEGAITLLPVDYVSSSRTRPNRYAAYALLARVALYAGQYEVSSNAASAVLNETSLYTNESDLNQVFKKESKTTIWQFSPGWTGNNALEAQTFIFQSGPPPVSALTESLIAAFEPNDLRLQNWVRGITSGSTTWYHAFKYKVAYGTPETENSVVLRTGEVYLIRAEARARSGELIGAREDLNVIRQLAGLAPSNASNQEELLEEILEERRLELFTEFGHRFFDLKRFGLIQSTLSLQKPGWDATDALFPLPEDELLLNPALAPQNPGY